MTSSDPSQRPSEQAPQEQANDPSTGSPSLDEVVRETLDIQNGQQALAPEVRAAFTEIARRHRDKPTLDEAILKELVDSVLACRLEQLRTRPEVREAAASRITEVFWDDTPSRERLDRLWKTLREALP